MASLYVATGVCQSLPVTLEASSNSNSLIMVTVSGDGCPHAVIAYIIIATGTATKAWQKRLMPNLLHSYLNLAYESLQRVQNSGTTSNIFREPCNRKAPRLFFVPAIQKKCNALPYFNPPARWQKDRVQNEYHNRSPHDPYPKDLQRHLLLFFKISKPICYQVLRAYPACTRCENHHPARIIIQPVVCTIKYTSTYTE
jgi:hypothetical protein